MWITRRKGQRIASRAQTGQIEGPIFAETEGKQVDASLTGAGGVGRSVDAAWPLFGRRHFASQSWPTLRRPPFAHRHPPLLTTNHPPPFTTSRPDAPPPSFLAAALLRPFRFPLFLRSLRRPPRGCSSPSPLPASPFPPPPPPSFLRLALPPSLPPSLHPSY